MKTLKRDIENLCKGYEDEEHPCFNCFVKGICSSTCQGISDYEKDLQKVAKEVGRKFISKNKFITKRFLFLGEFTIRNMIDYFNSIEGKHAEWLLDNEEILSFIRKAQYTTKRQELILKNYIAKNPNFGSESVSSSSVSATSSSCAGTPNRFPFSTGGRSSSRVPPTNVIKLNSGIKTLQRNPQKKFNKGIARRNV